MMAANTVKSEGVTTLPASYEKVFNIALERQGLKGPKETVKASDPAAVKKEVMKRVMTMMGSEESEPRVVEKEDKVGLEYVSAEDITCIIGNKGDVTWNGGETDAILIVLDDVTQYKEYDDDQEISFRAVVGDRGGMLVWEGSKIWVQDDDGNRMEFFKKKFAERKVIPAEGVTQEQAEDSCNKLLMAYAPNDGNVWEQALFDEESVVGNNHIEFMDYYMR